MVKSTVASPWSLLQRHYKGLIREHPEIHPTPPENSVSNAVDSGQNQLRFVAQPEAISSAKDGAAISFSPPLKWGQKKVKSIA